MRWPHPTLGLLQPGEFIDIVEATNLAGELGRWVTETACRQLKRWHGKYGRSPLGLSVNVSPGATDHHGLRRRMWPGSWTNAGSTGGT